MLNHMPFSVFNYSAEICIPNKVNLSSLLGALPNSISNPSPPPPRSWPSQHSKHASDPFRSWTLGSVCKG